MSRQLYLDPDNETLEELCKETNLGVNYLNTYRFILSQNACFLVESNKSTIV